MYLRSWMVGVMFTGCETFGFALGHASALPPLYTSTSTASPPPAQEVLYVVDDAFINDFIEGTMPIDMGCLEKIYGKREIETTRQLQTNMHKAGQTDTLLELKARGSRYQFFCVKQKRMLVSFTVRDTLVKLCKGLKIGTEKSAFVRQFSFVGSGPMPQTVRVTDTDGSNQITFTFKGDVLDVISYQGYTD